MGKFFYWKLKQKREETFFPKLISFKDTNASVMSTRRGFLVFWGCFSNAFGHFFLNSRLKNCQKLMKYRIRVTV